MLILWVSVGLGALYLLGVALAFFCAFPMRELHARAEQPYPLSNEEEVYE